MPQQGDKRILSEAVSEGGNGESYLQAERLCQRNTRCRKTHPTIVFGGVTLSNCMIPIQVKGIALFEVAAAEEIKGPFRLSANFHNSKGQVSLEIIDNEWRAHEANWDVEAVGGTITVRDAPGHVSLQLAAAPPDGIIVERLDMKLAGVRFVGSPGELMIIKQNGSRMTMTRCLADHCVVGLAIG